MPKILYCVLNWGLGHATRSIPVIRILQAEGYTVDIASDGGPLTFLQKTFPECVSHQLSGYNVLYPTESVFLNIVGQSYKILRAIRTEHRQIEELVKTRQYHAILSDNRYGCYHASIPSILISHQLSNVVKSSSILNKPGEWILNRFFKNFDEVWIPDTPDRILSGKLTDKPLKKMRFIGHLSDQVRSPQEKQYDIAAILSGPEPQRTRLEKEILPQLIAHQRKCVLVQGVMHDHPPVSTGDVTIFPYHERSGINALLNSSEIIVCRTGYSSLMDLLSVGAKAILIPTPGQPEQEYLAERMQGYEQFVVQKQGVVDIQTGVDHLKYKTITRMTVGDDELLKNALMSLKGRIEGGGANSG